MNSFLKRGLGLLLPLTMVPTLPADCSPVELFWAAPADIGPSPDFRVALDSFGLPVGFFGSGEETKCGNQIIGYRFVVWLNDDAVAVGFNISPDCRQSPDSKVNGLVRILVFNSSGVVQAKRDVPYLADGNGEVVAPGQAAPGPAGTLLLKIESVNLDKEGRRESKSGVRLLDANLKDLAQVDGFLEQTTSIGHALVFQEGAVPAGPRTYSIQSGIPLREIQKWTIDWPTGTRDRKFGEHSFAFVSCRQELSPGQYSSNSVIYAGAKTRCAVNGQDKQVGAWNVPLKDGDNTEIVALLADSGVVGQARDEHTEAGRLMIYRKGETAEAIPWLPPQLEGTVDSATSDFSRYASFAMSNAHSCNPLQKISAAACDESEDGKLFIFDRRVQTPIVDRTFPKNGRAALSPSGLRYASFESGELRIYPLPRSR